MADATPTLDPDRDLVLERVVDVPPEKVWAAWTRPEHLVKWFAPAPWSVSDCRLDVRPGGVFYTVMRSPEGEDHPSEGCYLEVVENRRLVFTDALEGGYRPSSTPGLGFTAVVTMEPEGAGTRYRAVALHGSADTRRQHEDMGFHDGWSAALDQLVALAREL